MRRLGSRRENRPVKAKAQSPTRHKQPVTKTHKRSMAYINKPARKNVSVDLADKERSVGAPAWTKNDTRPGFDVPLKLNGGEHFKPQQIRVPKTKVFVLPASSKIGRQYIDDIRTGRVIQKMYGDITQKQQQPVYNSSFSYVHQFRVHERNHRDFLKRLALIEAKLTQRFGSTYFLHVGKSLRKYKKRWAYLRSAFVNKKAQDHYTYTQNEYVIKVSYAFALTDPVINDFIYSQLKKIVLAAGVGHSFGYYAHHWSETVSESQYTSLSNPALDKPGTIPEIAQVKYANYVGQQEILRQYCIDRGLDFNMYAGDPSVFPWRDQALKAKNNIDSEELSEWDPSQYNNGTGSRDEYDFTDSGTAVNYKM